MKERTPHIVFLSPSNQYWGAEQSLRAIATGIARSGMANVSVVTRSRELVERLNGGGVATRLVECRSSRLATGLRFAMQALRSSAGSVVVVFDLKIVPFIVAVSPLLRLQGKRLVLDVHDVPRRTQRLYRSIQMARAFDIAICVSRYAAAQIRGTKVHVVHRPVADAGVSRVASSSDEELVFGVVGRVDPEKKVALAPELLRDVRDARLLVRGEPGIRSSGYLNEVLRRGHAEMGDKFSYEGRVAPDEVMDGLDVLLFLNDREPSGRAIVEAQLAGVVVVAPDCGGASEFVEDLVTGIKIDVVELDRAQQRIADLACDPAMRTRLREAARTHALGAYAADRQAALYARALLGERSVSRSRAHGAPRDSYVVRETDQH